MKKIALFVVALISTSVFALGTTVDHPYQTPSAPQQEVKKEAKDVVVEMKDAKAEAKKATESKVASDKVQNQETNENETLNYL